VLQSSGAACNSCGLLPSLHGTLAAVVVAMAIMAAAVTVTQEVALLA